MGESLQLIRDECPTLEPIWADRARDLLDENLDTRGEKVQELRLLAKQETGLHLPEEEDFYLLFLRAGKSNPTEAMEIIKSYFSLRKTNPEYLQVRMNTFKVGENMTVTYRS